MNSEILELVLSAAVPAVTILLTWCASSLVSFLNTKKEEAKTKTNNETVKTYIDLVADNATNVVESLNQTLVEQLKAASADGKLTAEDATNIKNTAFTMLVDTLSDDVLEIIGTVFGDTKTYLNNVIEKAVTSSKKDKKN